MKRKFLAITLLAFAGGAMSAPTESLEELEVGSYAELASRPNPKRLALQYIPSLAAVLASVERKKGTPLGREEVEAVKDSANAMAIQPAAAKAMDDRRGYRDVDPSHAWQEWQVLRHELAQ